MGSTETFKGYGPEQGYEATRNAVAAYYKKNGVDVEPEAIFISDGAKSDTGNITDLFGPGNVILIPDPVYPVYVDTNIMCGNEVTYLPGNAENDFLPMPDRKQHADIIYLCSPNNPTGACYNKEQLSEWVDYALANDAVILLTLPMRRLSLSRNFQEASMPSKAPENVPLNSVPCPRPQALPEPAADIPLFQKNWSSRLQQAL